MHEAVPEIHMIDPHQTHQYLGCSSINIMTTLLTIAPEFEARQNGRTIEWGKDE